MFSSFEEVVCSPDCVTRNSILKSFCLATWSKTNCCSFLPEWPLACAVNDEFDAPKSKKNYAWWEMSVPFLCWIETVLSAMMDSPPKACHKHLRAKCLFFHLAWHPSSCSQYYKVSFLSSGSMVLWDSSTLAHKGILGVRGLLSLDMASRHKLSSTGRAGTISLSDLWSRNNEKHNKKIR